MAAKDWKVHKNVIEIRGYFLETIELPNNNINHITSERFHIAQYYFFPAEKPSMQPVSKKVSSENCKLFKTPLTTPEFKNQWCRLKY